MPTEFISLTFPNASTELAPIPNAAIDPTYLARYAKSLDDYAFNYTLVPYDSSSYDPFTIGATIAAHTKNLKIIIALRPNTLYPTVAAKALATLDQLSNGRAVVHFVGQLRQTYSIFSTDISSPDRRRQRRRTSQRRRLPGQERTLRSSRGIHPNPQTSLVIFRRL